MNYSLISLYPSTWFDFRHLAMKYPSKTIMTSPPRTAPTMIGIKSLVGPGATDEDTVLLLVTVVWVVQFLHNVVVAVVVGEVFLAVVVV